ncbi:MAG: type II toxin-antitoxin system PemK/MazF family toxin [Candidatus Symbiobacter sp.]|nr:type II toxin-antitoxin system PemK/MazF family toxin [Candidatus Symbiobacter sp.]
MTRGEIWIASLKGDYLGKPRPVLILQSYLTEPALTITVCPLSSAITESNFFRPVIQPSFSNGLAVPSQIALDRISTVPIAKLSKMIGVMDTEHFSIIDQLLVRFFAIKVKELL